MAKKKKKEPKTAFQPKRWNEVASVVSQSHIMLPPDEDASLPRYTLLYTPETPQKVFNKSGTHFELHSMSEDVPSSVSAAHPASLYPTLAKDDTSKRDLNSYPIKSAFVSKVPDEVTQYSGPPSQKKDSDQSSQRLNLDQIPVINPPPPAYEDPYMIMASQSNETIPVGYRVERTAKGQPFLVKEDGEPAEMEHAKAKERLSVFATWDQMEDHYGLGIRLYFDFARSLILVNALLTLIQAANFFTYIGYDLDAILSSLSNLSFGILTEILYASNYSPKLVWIWRGTNIAAIFLSFLYGPVYWIYTNYTFRKKQLFDHEENFSIQENDIIEENLHIGKVRKVLRFITSYSIFALLFFQLIVVAGLTFLQNFTAIYKVIGVATSGKDVISSNQLILTPISFGISFVIGVSNYLWGVLCAYLTKFEKHRTWSGFRAHNTIKLLVFKLISVFIMGFAKGFFATPCIISVLGNQYLIQIMLDLVVFNAIELFLPIIMLKFRKRGDKSDEESRPEFDVAEEYLELVYRQYVVYCGMAAFPMMTFVGAIASIVELYLDKIRLIKICKKPPRTTGSIKSVVSFFLILSALLALLNWG